MRLFSRLVLVALVGLLCFGCGKKSGIEGKVLDGKGQPVSGVKIIAKQAQPIKGFEQFETTTGSDGIFLFKGLFPASNYEIFIGDKDLLKWEVKTSTEAFMESGPEGQTKILAPLIIRYLTNKEGVITDTKTGHQWSINKYGIITDIRTGLQWAPASRPSSLSWANDYAKELRLGESSDWRLPTREELRELLGGGLMFPAFNITNVSSIYSSEKNFESDCYYTFNFLNGREACEGPFGGGVALPVRSPR